MLTVRRLLVVVSMLTFACGLEASVQTSQPSKSLVNQSALTSQNTRISTLELMKEARKNKPPVTAMPANGKSFANEFVGEVTPSSEPDKTAEK
jgi:hypothetical protein